MIDEVFLSIVKLVLTPICLHILSFILFCWRKLLYSVLLYFKCNCNLAAPTVRGIYVVREWLLLFSYYCVVVLTVAFFGYSTVVYYLAGDSQNNISTYVSGLWL